MIQVMHRYILQVEEQTIQTQTIKAPMLLQSSSSPQKWLVTTCPVWFWSYMWGFFTELPITLPAP